MRTTRPASAYSARISSAKLARFAPSASSRSETLHDSGLLVLERRQLGLRPVALVGLERGEHLLEPVGGEQPRDRGQVRCDLGVRRRRGECADRALRARSGACRDALDQVGERRLLDIMGRKAEVMAFARRRAGRRSAP